MDTLELTKYFVLDPQWVAAESMTVHSRRVDFFGDPTPIFGAFRGARLWWALPPRAPPPNLWLRLAKVAFGCKLSSRLSRKEPLSGSDDPGCLRVVQSTLSSCHFGGSHVWSPDGAAKVTGWQVPCLGHPDGRDKEEEEEYHNVSYE